MQWMCLEASARLASKIHILIEESDKNGVESITIQDLKNLREEVVNEVCSPDGYLNQTLAKAREEKLEENLN